jgi:aspartate/methionine/tyrosine aminotransferase
MHIDEFKVEGWMNAYEDYAKYNLGETCVDSLTVGELLALCGKDQNEFMNELSDIRLTYGYILGSDELKNGIAALYKNILPEDILPAHGAIEANHQLHISLAASGKNVVTFTPIYQQHTSIPASCGVEVRELELQYLDAYQPDIGKLRSLVDADTYAIVLNNPNNPTGALIPDDTLREIVSIAKSASAYVICDEVYRGISDDGSYMTSITDLYDKGISTGSMSKAYALAGIRLGWIATKDKDVLRLIEQRRDYDTISVGVISDKLASLALSSIDKISARSRGIILENRRIVDDWVNSEVNFHYVKPICGTTALLCYDKPILSRDFADRLAKEQGVLVVPGECFGVENSIRVGYAFDSKQLSEGLRLISELMKIV